MVAIFLKAADVLFAADDPELYGQAIARAYYALQAISEFYAMNEPRLCPPDPSDPSRPAQKISHQDVPQIVGQVVEHRARAKRTNRERHECKSWASVLVTKRMDADYRGYKMLSKEASRRYIAEARAISGEMLDEIQYIIKKPTKGAP